MQRQGQDTVTTVFDDYRDVEGVRVAFHATTDMTDAAGRTDPRRQSEIKLAKATLNGAVADADFAMPAMAPTARIVDGSGTTRIPFDLVNNHIYASGTIDGIRVHAGSQRHDDPGQRVPGRRGQAHG